jgi:hypothetical protein
MFIAEIRKYYPPRPERRTDPRQEHADHQGDVAALVVPLLIGGATVWLLPAGSRPRGAGLLISLIRGYPFTLALAGTIVWLGLIALVSKLYEEVLDCLRSSLEAASSR